MLEVKPLNRPVDATLTVPGSKSYTNRALVMAALADGQSILHNALFSDDTHHMIESLGRLGIEVIPDEGRSLVEVTGCAGKIPAPAADLFVGNSGTCARFLTGIVALGHGRYTIDGVQRMRERPIGDLLEGLKPLGVRAISKYDNGCPPVVVKANGMEGGVTRIPGETSSQYISAIMLAAPCAKNDVEIHVVGDLVSKPYIDITLAGMQAFGAGLEHRDNLRFRIRGGTGYLGREYEIEPDASNAAYFWAAAALTGGRARVRDLNLTSAQGDVHFVDVLEKMGCRVEVAQNFIEVTGPKKLRGIDVDLNRMPDTAQTLAAIAPFADGPTTIRNVASLRIKETDRIAAVVTELRKLGVHAVEHPDGLVIPPAKRIHPAAIDTYDDHRMAMSFALVGLKAEGILIDNPDCVTKTFPGYFDKLGTLGGD